MVTVDRADGRTAPPIVAQEVKADGSLVQYPVMGIVLLSAFVAALLLRPLIDQAPAQPAEGLRGLGLARRAAGLCIDITPAAMIVVVIYGLDPAVFVKDVMAGDLAVASPLIATELLAGGLAGILEVLTGASLGKWLVGGRILDLEGRPAGRAQRGLRRGSSSRFSCSGPWRSSPSSSLWAGGFRSSSPGPWCRPARWMLRRAIDPKTSIRARAARTIGGSGGFSILQPMIVAPANGFAGIVAPGRPIPIRRGDSTLERIS